MDRVIAQRYAVQASLGRGGMGEVFLARDLLLQRRVAVKEILGGRDSGLDPVSVERFIREARLAAGIHHPHVVAVYDLIVEDGQTYIVMEYLEARSLAELIRTRGRLEPSFVAKVGSQVAGALDAAHRLGIIHRDVKPANILLNEQGDAKLADFGVARSSVDSGLTSTGMVVGSVAYMAPEVAKGDPATPAADVFSLGCTLYAATEGHPPFVDPSEPSNSMRMLVRLISHTAPPAVQAGGLAPLLSRMLDPDPAGRPVASEVQRLFSVPGAYGDRPSAPASPSGPYAGQALAVPGDVVAASERESLTRTRVPPTDATILRPPPRAGNGTGPTRKRPDATNVGSRGVSAPRPLTARLALVGGAAALLAVGGGTLLATSLNKAAPDEPPAAASLMAPPSTSSIARPSTASSTTTTIVTSTSTTTTTSVPQQTEQHDKSTTCVGLRGATGGSPGTRWDLRVVTVDVVGDDYVVAITTGTDVRAGQEFSVQARGVDQTDEDLGTSTYAYSYTIGDREVVALEFVDGETEGIPMDTDSVMAASETNRVEFTIPSSLLTDVQPAVAIGSYTADGTLVDQCEIELPPQ